MRPTTAFDDNVFDFDYLLHPGTKFEHPRDVVSHSGLTRREACDPGLMGLRRLRDRVLPGAAGSRGPEGARDHRRHSGCALRSGRRSAQPTGRQANAPALDGTAGGRLRRKPCKNSICRIMSSKHSRRSGDESLSSRLPPRQSPVRRREEGQTQVYRSSGGHDFHC
jgi:hypothetical protein